MGRVIEVTLRGTATDLYRTLRQSGREVENLDRTTVRAGRSMGASWRSVAAGVIAAVSVTALLATGLRATVGAAAQFETSMRNVNSITAASEAQFRGMSSQVLAISRDLPQSANTLAQGFYEIASSGFQGAEGLTVLTRAAEAASAGLSTTQVAGGAITSVLNAYGLSAQSAGYVSDVLFQTVNLGVVSFEELAGSIGDVVGGAAAARVGIDQVGAAIATMTLTGISGAESATSLNRLITATIDPSKELAAALEGLGYESGVQALKTDGLRVVMDRLRTATGGQIDQLIRLYPEIRAARGALALMSNEGRNYARVSREIENRDRVQGATQRALREQMKATGAQWRLFRNQVQEGGIRAGLAVLPVIQDLLRAATALGQQGLPVLAEGFERLGPFLRSVRDIGGDVVTILSAIYNAAEPVAQVLLGIGGSAVIGALSMLGGALSAVTGFIADHEKVVITLAAVYAATLLPSLHAMYVAFNRLILTNLVLGFVGLAGAAGTATAGVTGLTAALSGLITVQAVATAGFAAIFAGVALAAYSWQQASAGARDFVTETTAAFDALDPKKSRAVMRELERTADAAAEYGKRFDGVGGNFRAAWSGVFGDADDIAHRGAAARKELQRLSEVAGNAESNLTALSQITGLAKSEIAGLAAENNIDLTKPIRKSGYEIKQVTDLVGDLRATTGLSTEAMSANFGNTQQALENLAKAVQETGDAVDKAFSSGTDVIAAYDPAPAAAKVVAARERIRDAEQRLADTQTRQGGKRKRSVSDEIALTRAQQRVAEASAKGREKAERALADLQARQAAKGQPTAGDEVALAAARRGVAEATKELADAQAEVAAADLESTYTRTVDLARTFQANLQAAAERGLDPQVIARLLEKGPEAAAPYLQAIVSDHSGRLIELANKSERTLRTINRQVVEFSRLTTLAVNAETDQLAADLGTAMAIAAEKISQGAGATAASIAKAIGVPSAEVVRVAEAYGITIAKAVQRGIDSLPVTIKTPSAGKLQQLERQTLRRAAGGPVYGPGTATSDSIPALLSNGEHVMTAYEVQKLGGQAAVQSLRAAVRSGWVPRFAAGGPVETRGRGGGTATVVRIPVQENRTHEAPVYVEHMQVADYDDFRRQEDRARRFRSSPGNLGG